MQLPKAVIFDMDGLIIDSEPLWRVAEIDGFRPFGLNLSIADCELTMGWRIDEVVNYWYRKQPWKNGTQQEVIESILLHLEKAIREQGTMLPGIPEVIAFFQEQNIPIALASSSPKRVIDTVLKALQLEHTFQIVRSAEKEAWGKPHPAVFIHTAEDLNVHPEDCWVLEDSVYGVIAARAAKMYAIAIPAEHHLKLPEFGIANQIFPSAKVLVDQLRKS